MLTPSFVCQVWCPNLAPCVRKGCHKSENYKPVNLYNSKQLSSKYNLTKNFIYIHRSGIYSVIYIYSESHLLVLLYLHCLQNLTFTFTKSSQTYMWWTPLFWPFCMRNITDVLFGTYRIKTRFMLYSLVGIHKYGRPL